MEDPRKVSPQRRSRRFARAGLVVAIIVGLTIVVFLVGRIVWHADVLHNEVRTGVANPN